MLVFIDDSGDPGFKLTNGSSRYFVIACVIFDDNLDAEETALKIKRYRRSLGWSDEREFKFNKLTQRLRLDFLQEVAVAPFRVRAIVVDKSKIHSQTLRTDKNSFYNFIIKEVLSHSGGHIQNANIRLDGHEDRAYKRAASSYFRTQVASGTIKDVRFVDSKTNNLIQLADMVAGSLLRNQQADKTDHATYRSVIAKRIEDEWHFH